MYQKIVGWIKSILSWMFGAPVTDLPPTYGNTIPVELRLFAVQSARAQTYEQEQVRHRGLPSEYTHPGQKNIPIERL